MRRQRRSLWWLLVAWGLLEQAQVLGQQVPQLQEPGQALRQVQALVPLWRRRNQGLR